jgi:prostaglandin-H2 D-isomerase / glutathione transferase
MATTYKLVYFDLKGRAELSRLIFAYCNQQYENKIIQFEEWPEYKKATVFGQLPMLEIHENGRTHVIAQSIAIARFLANRFGISGKNDIERAQVDMIVDQV